MKIRTALTSLLFCSVTHAAASVGRGPAPELPPTTCALSTQWSAVDFAGRDYVFTGQCSADVMSSTHVVTAAHCFNRKLADGSRLKAVIAQFLYCASSGKTYPMHTSFTTEPRYAEDEPGRRFDVAVVATTEPFDIKPVALPKYSLETYLLARANACVLTGYRATADFTRASAHAEPNPHFAGSRAIERLSAAAVARSKAPLPIDKLFSYGEIGINPGDSGGGVLCKNLAGDWVRVATIDSIRMAGSSRLVAFESTYADRDFLLPFTDQKTAPAYARAYVEDLRGRGDPAADYELHFQDLLRQWDDVWPLPEQTFGNLTTPDEKDVLLTPLWDQLSGAIKLIGWQEFVN